MNSPGIVNFISTRYLITDFYTTFVIKSKQECKKYQTIPFSSVSAATHLNNAYVFVFTFY